MPINASEITECIECGSTELSWCTSNAICSEVHQGRLNTSDVLCQFVLGCNVCSATLSLLDAEDVARLMNAPLLIDSAVERTTATHRAMIEEGIALARADCAYECIVPWLDGKSLTNAVGTSEAECHANLAMLDLDDAELQRVTFRNGVLQILPEEEIGTDLL